MSEEQQGGWQVERWVSFGATIIAPATVLSALLFYFGYVSSRTQYEYFGIDVDTVGLSTQDYVMRSPQPLLFPLLVLTLIGISALWLHVGIVRRIDGAQADPENPARLARYAAMARWAMVAGWVVIGVGVLLFLGYAFVREWPAYHLVTPLVLAVGAVLVRYASRVRERLQPGEKEPPSQSEIALRRMVTALVLVLIVANLFWATATVAQWSGRGVAHDDAAHLDRLPSVILDTKERLYLRSPGIEETVLQSEEGQTFHYRYRHLRLLIQGGDRMFLVPDEWSASNSTLVVPLDGSVRVQFQFRNDPP
jgi:hypothetical protein